MIMHRNNTNIEFYPAVKALYFKSAVIFMIFESSANKLLENKTN